jgi:ankyrin repeat protein
LRKLLQQGASVTPDALLAAVESWKMNVNDEPLSVSSATVKSLELLLAAGANPNWRCSHADESNSLCVDETWASGKISTELEFWPSRREYYPLFWAGIAPHPGGAEAANPWKEHLSALQTILLKYGANPFARFRQPLAPQKYSGFPGVDRYSNTDEEHARVMFDLKDMPWMSQYSLRYREQQGEIRPIYEERKEEEMERSKEFFDLKLFNDSFADEFTTFDSSFPDPSTVFSHFGVRSVLHALLEDGGFVKPILESGIDLEHRDPQGRTLFLSACRSILGADAAIDGKIDDIHWDTENGGFLFNPFPQTDLPMAPLSQKTQDQITLFQFFLRKGANAIAIDNYGKHALLHLLEAFNHHNPSRPPVIRKSVQFLAKNFPQLVNQPDNAGNYPIHAALRRLQRFNGRNRYTDAAEVEPIVHDLLDAGGNPRVLDERGNSVLDYLSDTDLADNLQIEEQQRLYSLFVGLGLDSANH